ncbi:MAG: protein-export chaperone SecB [Holosporales bacterium]|jgi:preprotein translocase subunit SecB|nr:protein-export chaperone SecB [Holosporales bacterium]
MTQPAEKQAGPVMGILAQYIKDLSFEVPNARQNVEKAPDIEVNMHVRTDRPGEDKHTVFLDIRASAKQKGEPLFLLELTYAGLFLLQNFSQKDLALALYVEGPRLLFPFARSFLAHVTAEGGFPPLYLAPVNFLEMYEKNLSSADKSSDPSLN